MCIPILLTVMKKYGHFWRPMIEANRLLQVKSVLLCNIVIFLNLYSLECGFRFLKPFFNHKVKCGTARWKTKCWYCTQIGSWGKSCANTILAIGNETIWKCEPVKVKCIPFVTSNSVLSKCTKSAILELKAYVEDNKNKFRKKWHPLGIELETLGLFVGAPIDFWT